MRSSPRRGALRRTAIGLAGAALTSSLALIASVAQAPTASAALPSLPDITLGEAVARFADCPKVPAGIIGDTCLHVSIHSGEIKLGDVEAQVSDPIDITLSIGIDADALAPVIVLPDEPPVPMQSPLEELIASLIHRTTACGRGVPVSGGVLGIPELDPLLALDPLSLLCVSASPVVGTPAPAGGQNFLNYLNGTNQDDQSIGVPLTIQLNNLLFGDQCFIGTDTNPIQLNLTNGTSETPPGVAPLSGSNGEILQRNFDHPIVGPVRYASRIGTRFVDNGFSVPGATKCDLLVGDLLDQPAGLFDSVIDNMVGIPSPAGNNRVAFTVDFETLMYSAVYPARIDISTDFLDFGTVPVGTASAPQTITYTNSGAVPVLMYHSLDSFPGPAFASSGCLGVTLAPGEACTLSVTYTPDRPNSFDFGQYRTTQEILAQPGAFWIGLSDGGSTALSAPTVDFGTVFSDQRSAPKTATFTNDSAGPVTVAQVGISAPDATARSQYEVAEDGCTGATLAPGNSCEVQVVADFISLGSMGDASVTARAADGAVLGNAAFSGSVTFALAGPAAAFGPVAVSDRSDPIFVPVTNVSPQPVTVGPVAFNIADYGKAYEVGNGCTGRTLAPGATCEMTVTFAPKAIGGFATQLLFKNGTRTSGGFDVSGNGTAMLVADEHVFSTVPNGTESDPVPLTFTNVGGAPAEYMSVGLIGADTEGFRIDSETCSTSSVPVGGTCVVNLVFAPPAGSPSFYAANVELRRGSRVLASTHVQGASS